MQGCFIGIFVIQRQPYGRIPRFRGDQRGQTHVGIQQYVSGRVRRGVSRGRRFFTGFFPLFQSFLIQAWIHSLMPWLTYLLSVTTRTEHGRLSALSPSMTAFSSMRLLVVWGSPPDNFFSWPVDVWRSIVPQPPGPGFPLHAPSVKMMISGSAICRSSDRISIEIITTSNPCPNAELLFYLFLWEPSIGCVGIGYYRTLINRAYMSVDSDNREVNSLLLCRCHAPGGVEFCGEPGV